MVFCDGSNLPFSIASPVGVTTTLTTDSHAEISPILTTGSHFDHASADGDESQVAFYLPPQRRLSSLDALLTGPTAGDPLQIARQFLDGHAAELGLSSTDLANFVVSDRYTDEPSGITHIYLRQTYGGLEVMNADLSIGISGQGEVISVASSFVGDARTVDALQPQPFVSAPQAYAALSGALGLELRTAPQVVSVDGRSPDSATVLAASGVARGDVPAKLVYVPTAAGLELAWRLNVQTNDLEHWYDGFVNVATGESLYASDWSGHATYNVFATPLESPDDGGRSIVANPHDATASPFGWHDTNGVAGAEYIDTRGNNVFAQEDQDKNDTGGFRPSGGAGLDFDFPINFSQDPTTYQSAAITNLFYTTNLLHDIYYRYGFTEAAGNFQVNNYGRGGTDNDPLMADAQDGDGLNNGIMLTPPDGQSPRMQVYLYNRTSPRRDGVLDNGIVIHEYGHGVSRRLTGGPANSNSLDALQSHGLSEGWSDWHALMLTQVASDAKLDAYPLGAYAYGQAASGSGGVRRYPYSFDMSVNSLTFDDFNGGLPNNESHNAGEIWCSALWDLNWLLIDKHGYSSDLVHGNAGNNLALQLVMDGLKLQGANPSFLAARDAILAADAVRTGGQNKAEIWTAFARRGMGFSASDGGNANSFTVTEAFDLPPLGAVSGAVFQDDDGNGVRNGVEAGLAGWTVYRDSNHNGVFDLATTSTVFHSTDTPKAITDRGITYSNLAVAGLPGVITDINVTVNVAHPSDGELYLTLLSPGNTPVILSNYQGGGGDNFTNTVFDDEATTAIYAGSAPFTGSFKPHFDLARLDNTTPNGVWKLRMDDSTSGNAGTLLSWSLEISYFAAEPHTVTDANGSYSFSNLADGAYRIREVLQPGYTQTGPASGDYEAVVSAGQPVIGRNFGNRAAATVANVATLEDTLSSAIPIAPTTNQGITHFRISGITGGTLFKNNGATPIMNGDYITVAEGQTGVKFLPSPDSNLAGRFDVELSQDGATVFAGSSKSTSTITVTPVADAPTSLTLSNASIAENRPAGATVGLFLTADPDAGDAFTYTLTSGPGDADNGRFSIDAGGALTASAAFDFEARSSYDVRVRSTDAAGLFVEQTFLVVITDESESGAQWSGTSGDDQFTLVYGASNFTVTLAGNDGAPALLGTYALGMSIAIDGLGGNDQLTIALTPRQLGDLTTADLLQLKDYLAAPTGKTLSLVIPPANANALTALGFEIASLAVNDDGGILDISACMPAILGEAQIQIGGDATDDVIYGTGLADLIFGQGGHDSLYGLDGSDCLFGGAGHDRIFGGNLDDLLLGGSGNDLLYGENGLDRLAGGAGADQLAGGSQDDQLDGGPGADTVYGNAGYDTIKVRYDEAVGDVMNGGDNVDKIVNDANAPVVVGNFNAATSSVESWLGNNQPVLGTDAANVVSFQIGASYSMTLSGVTYVDGRGGNDTLTGTFGMDDLRGGDGDDLLFGLGGVDVLYGDAGNDALNGGDGNDYLFGGDGVDTITTGAGRDIVLFSADTAAMDVITDFASYSDKIVLRDYGVTYATLVFDSVTSPGSTIISLPGGKKIKLLNWNGAVASSQIYV